MWARIWASRVMRLKRSPRLVERLDEGADYRDIPGIVYRDDANGGEVVVSEGRFASNFHRAPRRDLLDMRAYNGSGFGVGVITKLAQSYYPDAGRGLQRHRLAHPRPAGGGGRNPRTRR